MIPLKKFFIYSLFFLLLNNCGFAPIYSLENKKEISVGIKELKITGDHTMNRTLERLLSPYKNISGKEKIINIDINNTKTKEIALKDAKGDPSQYLITVSTNLSFEDINSPMLNAEGKEIWRDKSFTRKFNYQNIDNKFDLRRYEESVRKNLMMQINKDVFLYLSNIK